MDADAPAMSPQLVPIADLKLDPANARTHDDKNIGTITASLRRFTQRKPIVVNSRTMIVEAGNGTVEAAKAAGATEIVVVFVEDDDETAAAYAIADNRTAELADWDMGALTTNLAEFPDFDWGSIGFTAEDLAALAPGDIPPPPEHPEDFPEYDDETIETQYACPKCAYEWSGKPKADAPAQRQVGQPRTPARDGDKRQARRRVQTLIQNGTLPAPADVTCVDCGDVPGREYDHHLGYDAAHHEHVEALCASCHHKREAERAKATS